MRMVELLHFVDLTNQVFYISQSEETCEQKINKNKNLRLDPCIMKCLLYFCALETVIIITVHACVW